MVAVAVGVVVVVGVAVGVVVVVVVAVGVVVVVAVAVGVGVAVGVVVVVVVAVAVGVGVGVKALLINSVIREWAKPNCIPLGLAYTAAVLERAGHEAEILDLNVLRWPAARFQKFVQANDHDLVGITGMVTQYKQIKHLVGMIRNTKSRQPIVVGGPITVLGLNLAKWLGIQVFKGESEYGLVPQLDMIVGSDVPGIWSGKIVEDLDELPWPAWDKLHMVEYANAPVGAPNKAKWKDGRAEKDTPRSMNLLATRGCPHRCSFCAHDFLGAKYRKRSPANVVAEMKELHRRYKISYFHTSDDNTMADRAWLREFCCLLREHPVLKDCTWGCAGRVDAAHMDVLLLMKQAGCVLIGYGVESGSQRMLDAYNKGTTVEQIDAALTATKTIFGGVDFSLMIGGPGESDDTVQETIDLCRRLKVRPEVVFMVTPYPGTALYEYARDIGLIQDEEKYVLSLGEQGQQIACNVSGQSNEWLVAAKKRIEDQTKEFGSLL